MIRVMRFKQLPPRWDDAYSVAGLFFFPLLAVAATAAAYAPQTWLPRCGLKRLTGLPCPTCGTWRGLCRLASGDVSGALRSQPLLVGAGVALAGVAAYALVTAVLRRPRCFPQFSRRERRFVWLMALVAILANWIFLIVDGR